ncbi:MAG: DUF296 domain-containing protein [Alphaproteobacteria bacterium]
MFSKKISEKPKTFALILETGDDVLDELRQFATREHLTSSSFKGIGAFSYVRTTWFNWETREYENAAEFNEQVEVLTLTGDIALDEEGKPALHCHLIVGRHDGTAHGGHLAKAIVRPTLEIILTEHPVHLQKQYDRRSGLSLIRC